MNLDREQLGEWLTAYIDGEMGDEQRALIEQLLRDDESARRQHDALRQAADLLAGLPRHMAPSSIAEDLNAHFERAELLGGEIAPEIESGSPRHPFRALLAMAATITVLATSAWFVTTQNDTGPNGGLESDGRMASLTQEADSSALDRIAPAIEKKNKATKPSPTLLASATFEQKLGQGLSLDAVRTHAFANETVQVEVVVADVEQQAAFNAQVISQLRKQRSQDLGSIAKDGSGQRRSAGRYYYEGKPTTNFSKRGDRQILIRGTRKELEELVGALPRARGVDISLRSELLSVKGQNRVQVALSGIATPVAESGGRKGAKEARETAPTDRASNEGNLLADILSTLDIKQLTPDQTRFAGKDKDDGIDEGVTVWKSHAHDEDRVASKDRQRKPKVVTNRGRRGKAGLRKRRTYKRAEKSAANRPMETFAVDQPRADADDADSYITLVVQLRVKDPGTPPLKRASRFKKNLNKKPSS